MCLSCIFLLLLLLFYTCGFVYFARVDLCPFSLPLSAVDSLKEDLLIDY